MTIATDLRAPFPYFGGKSRIASVVWDALGDVENYVEPFFGSGAVLLARPHQPRIETVNDLDHMICNFWRAVQADPDGVATEADWPVNEADLQARHYWLITEGRARVARCAGDPAHYDVRVAGWWLWGVCSWIGSGWCAGDGPWSWADAEWRQLPQLGNAGQGIAQWMHALSDRLRRVRVTCGDASRVLSESVTHRNGLTGVFLDPPYAAEDRAAVYSHDSTQASHEAWEWALEFGQRSDMRIVFAGYDTERACPSGWQAIKWKAHGGYGNQGSGRGRDNAERETLWLSPACVRHMGTPQQAALL